MALSPAMMAFSNGTVWEFHLKSPFTTIFSVLISSQIMSDSVFLPESSLIAAKTSWFGSAAVIILIHYQPPSTDNPVLLLPPIYPSGIKQSQTGNPATDIKLYV